MIGDRAGVGEHAAVSLDLKATSVSRCLFTRHKMAPLRLSASLEAVLVARCLFLLDGLIVSLGIPKSSQRLDTRLVARPGHSFHATVPSDRVGTS